MMRFGVAIAVLLAVAAFALVLAVLLGLVFAIALVVDGI